MEFEGKTDKDHPSGMTSKDEMNINFIPRVSQNVIYGPDAPAPARGV